MRLVILVATTVIRTQGLVLTLRSVGHKVSASYSIRWSSGGGERPAYHHQPSSPAIFLTLLHQ